MIRCLLLAGLAFATLPAIAGDDPRFDALDKAIRAANLGLNPIVDGQTLRIPIPPLTGERRQELAKIAGKYAE